MHFSSFVQTRLNDSPPPPPPSPPPPIIRARLACRGGWREAHGGKKSMWGKRRLLFECNHIRLCERIYNNKNKNNNRKACLLYAPREPLKGRARHSPVERKHVELSAVLTRREAPRTKDSSNRLLSPTHTAPFHSIGCIYSQWTSCSVRLKTGSTLTS